MWGGRTCGACGTRVDKMGTGAGVRLITHLGGWPLGLGANPEIPARFFVPSGYTDTVCLPSLVDC